MAVFDFNNERAQNLSDAKFDKDSINLRTLKNAIAGISGATSGNLWSASTGANSIIANNGTGNLASGNASSIISGTGNTISGRNSVILGGASITSSLNDVAIATGFSLVTGTTDSTAGNVQLALSLATVNTTKVTDNSMIFICAQDNNSTGVFRISARISGTSFDITSSNPLDSGIVSWMIIEPAS